MVKNINCTNPIRLKEIFEADSSTRQINLPIYQRGFDWKTKHFDDFWQDLLDIDANTDPTEQHFYGLIYSEGPDPNADVIRLVDGQQRLTSCYLLLINIRDFLFRRLEFNKNSGKIVSVKKVQETTPSGKTCDVLKECDVSDELTKCLNSKEYTRNHAIYHTIESMLDKLESRLYNMDSLTQKPDYNRPLVQLGKLNRDFFRMYVTPQMFPDKKILLMTSKIKNDSIKKLCDAYSFFSKALDDIIKNDPKSAYYTINKLAWSLLDKFIVIRIAVPTERMAYVMFESINNRGTRLHNADLVKHKIFSILDKEFESSPPETRSKFLDQYDEIWEDIRNDVTGPSAADYQMDNFLFNYLVVNVSDNVTSASVLKEIDEKLESGVLKASSLVHDLAKWASIFNSIRNPKSDFFDLRTFPEIKFYLEKIRDLDAIHIYNPILRAYDSLYAQTDVVKKRQFSDLLKILTRYIVRNKTFGGSRAKPIELKMKKIMNLISKNSSNNKIIDNLMENDPIDSYIDESMLRNKISNYNEKWSANTEILIYVLEEINKTLASGPTTGTDITHEHILPKTLTKPWKDYIMKQMNFSEDQAIEFHKEYRHKLGNLTLLSNKENQQSARKLLDEKKPFYQTDGYAITNNVAKNYTEWTKVEIDKRNSELIDTVIDILDIDALKT